MTNQRPEDENESKAPKEIIVDGVKYIKKPELEMLEEPYANTSLQQLNG